MNTTDVQGTLREMWETRPARPRYDRQVAGVAAAIARRYDIDPTLVRVGFAVSAFAGVGAPLYLAGWALLPEEPRQAIHPDRRPPRPIILIGLVLASIASLGALLHDGIGGGGLLGGLAVATLLFLLHRSRSARGLAAAPVTGLRIGQDVGGSGASGAAPSVSLSKETPTAQEFAAQSPPAWDPLGAAPFAWDLPEPGTPPAPPAPRKPPVTLVTLGLALLGGAITTGILLIAGSFGIGTLPVVLGVMLTVLALGLAVGAFLRTGRGLIPVALLLIAMTWGVLSAPMHRFEGREAGDLRVAPTTVAELAPHYERSAGSIELDLRKLDLSVPPGTVNAEPVHTRASVGAGDVRVILPRDADVTINESVGIGSVSYDEQGDGGPGAELHFSDLGADGVKSGRPLVLDLEAGAGDLEVQRG